MLALNIAELDDEALHNLQLAAALELELRQQTDETFTECPLLVPIPAGAVLEKTALAR